jgi:hypothetical protein
MLVFSIQTFDYDISYQSPAETNPDCTEINSRCQTESYLMKEFATALEANDVESQQEDN